MERVLSFKIISAALIGWYYHIDRIGGMWMINSVCQKTINSHNIKILQEEPCLKIRFKSS
jgi:hypothetical protein